MRAHDVAMLARLRSDVELEHDVFEGEATGDPQRYVTVFSNTGTRESERLDNRQIQPKTTFTLYQVGHTPEQAQWVNGRCEALLLDWRPNVPGYRSWRLEKVSSSPLRVDRDVAPLLFYLIDEWAMTSTPKES